MTLVVLRKRHFVLRCFVVNYFALGTSCLFFIGCFIFYLFLSVHIKIVNYKAYCKAFFYIILKPDIPADNFKTFQKFPPADTLAPLIKIMSN